MTIAKPFAVGKFEVTFAEWDACGGRRWLCEQQEPERSRLGAGAGAPIINVSWNDAKEYVSWLVKRTGKNLSPAIGS